MRAKFSTYILLLMSLILMGCKKDITVAFTYSPEHPRAGETVSFVNTSTGGESWLWMFGDNTASSYRSPSHIFTAPGEYVVSVQADAEARYMASQTIIIADTMPVIDIADTLEQMTSVTFKALVFNPNNLTVNYLWQFSDNASVVGTEGNTSTEAQPTVYFLNSSNKETITLTVTVSGQKPLTVTKDVIVLEHDGKALYYSDINRKLMREPIVDNVTSMPYELDDVLTDDAAQMCYAENMLYVLLTSGNVIKIDNGIIAATDITNALSITANEGLLLWATARGIYSSMGALHSTSEDITAVTTYFNQPAYATASGIYTATNTQLSTLSGKGTIIDAMRSIIIVANGEQMQIVDFKGNTLAEIVIADGTLPYLDRSEGMLYYITGKDIERLPLGMPTRVQIGEPQHIANHDNTITAIAVTE